MTQRDAESREPATPVTGRVFITGATGFVGRSILHALGDRPTRILARTRENAAGLGGADAEVVTGDVTAAASLRGAMDGCEAVIHLVAIISEEGSRTFDQVIRQGTVNVVAEARRAGVRRFLHMSALGTRDDPRFGYFAAKWQAEQAVQQSGIPWTIFRPSIIFGPGDGFITTLAKLVRAAPVLPVVGSGQSTFQPIAVREVATAFARGLDDPTTAYQIYELGGGKTYTYEQILDAIARQLGKSPRKVHIPIPVMKGVVALSSPLPKALRPPVTREQLKMLAIDNATERSATATLIGRDPIRLEDDISYIGGARGGDAASRT